MEAQAEHIGMKHEFSKSGQMKRFLKFCCALFLCLTLAGCHRGYPWDESGDVPRPTSEKICLAYKRFSDFDVRQPIPDEIQNIKDPVPGDKHGRILINGTVLKVAIGDHRERKVTFKVNRVLLAQKRHVGSTIDVYTPVKDKEGFEFVPGKNYRVYVVPLDLCKVEWGPEPAGYSKQKHPKCKQPVKYFTWSPLAYEVGPHSPTAFKCRPRNLVHD